MFTTKSKTGQNNNRRLVSLVLASGLLVASMLAACDNSDTPGSSATPVNQAGSIVYTNYCQMCHPGGNAGAGPSIRPAVSRLSDAEVKHIVRNGKARMPAYPPTAITDDQLTQLVAYMREWK